MAPPRATSDFYGILQQYQLMLLTAGRRLWQGMAPSALDASWQQIGPQLVAFTAGAQLAAAQAANAYVPAVLAEQGIPDAPLVRVLPQAFSGVASDGRSLAGLLDGAVVASKRAAAIGLDGGDALLNGQRWLEMALPSAVMDAGRDATAANIVARPDTGWVRIVNPPCCSRCAVLGTTYYAWNKPNPRHPRCDCLIQPTTRDDADQYLVSPQKLLDQGGITDLSQAQRKRLDEGADLNKVLNESRDRWRVRMAADRRAAGPVDRAGRSRPTGWNGGGTNPPPVGTTVHDLMARLTDQVEAAQAMKATGLAK